MPAPLLFLHGALGTRAQLAPLARSLQAALAHASRTVQLPEFAGHGTTPLADVSPHAPAGGVEPPRREPPDASGWRLRIESLGEQLVRQLDTQEIATARLLGYSMGGYVALWLARHHPARVERVMTLGTKLVWHPEQAAREAAMLDAAAMQAKVPAFAERLAAAHPALGWEALVAATAEMMTWMGEHAPLTEADFRAIPHPVRVLVGDRDTTVSVEESAQVRRWLPNAELEVLPRTPHPFERVPLERLALSVREFLLSD